MVLPIDTREESFAAKPSLFSAELKKGFVGKFGFFRVSCETLKGFTVHPMKICLCTKLFRVS